MWITCLPEMPEGTGNRADGEGDPAVFVHYFRLRTYVRFLRNEDGQTILKIAGTISG